MKWDISKNLAKLDKNICSLFGFGDSADPDNLVKSSVAVKYDGKISVIVHEPYKRTYCEYDVGQFIQTQLPLLSDNVKQKFGSALGKAIANNLVLSFKRTSHE